MLTTHVESTACIGWNEFVAASPVGHYMQSDGWATLQQAAGWETTFVSVRDGSVLRASTLLLSRQVPVWGARVFYAPRGPVLHSADAEASLALLAGVRSLLRTKRGLFARFDPYWEEAAAENQLLLDSGLSHVPRTWSYWNAPKYVFWLDIDRTEDAVLKAMSSTWQREIRVGYTKGIEYRMGDASDLPAFYRIMVAMSAAKGIAAHDEAYYRRVYERMNSDSSQAGLFIASKEGVPCAIGLSVRQGAKAWLLYAASDRELAPPFVTRNLQWEMIKWARDCGCRRYDFRGTATGDPPSETDPGYGVYKFKKGFGPEFTRLAGYYDLVASRGVHGLARKAEDQLLPALYAARVRFNDWRGK